MTNGRTPDLRAKVVVVTGANSGIGLETASALASMGATVVMTARDRAKGEAALAEVRERSGNDSTELADLDLASFASVRAFAAWLLDRHDRIDVLVCNAGLILDSRRETAEGFEMMFGVNHLGHFLLFDLLRERLVASAPASVVVVSSVAHRFAIGGLDESDLNAIGSFDGFLRYSQSKLANLLFSNEAARQLTGTGVTVNAVHPGLINSGFGRDGDTTALAALSQVFGRIALRSPKGGARTSVMLASSNQPKVAGVSGKYFSHGRPQLASRRGRDVDAARWLWEESERLVAAASQQ